MASNIALNRDKRNQLDIDIKRKISEGYILYDGVYLISKNNDIPYKLYKGGSTYYTEMRPVSVAETAGQVSNGKEYFYRTISYKPKNSKYKGYRYYLHRLVWEAFKGPIPEKMTIDHIDGNKKNNNLSNLQLLTQKQNSSKGMIQTRAENKIKLEKPIKCNENGMEFKSVKEAAEWLPGNVATNKEALSHHLNDRDKSGYPVRHVKGFTFIRIGKATNDLKEA